MKSRTIILIIIPTYTYAEVELESQSSTRLSALHSSLQQEAEKIRKWRNTTELELKHKVKDRNCNKLFKE